MVQEVSIYFPRKLVIGKGSIEKLPDEIRSLLCKKDFILTIKPLLPVVNAVVKKLEGIEVQIDASVVQEPSFKDVEEMMKQARPFNPDCVIGIGGGSVLDVAKLVAALLDNGQSLRDITGNGLLKQRHKHLICLPATSGTGSEASPNSILVDETDNQKKGIISPFLVPDIVYIDPRLTVSVPVAVTAATGIDALTHCIEAYTNKFAHPFIDIYALEGIKLIGANIVKTIINGNDEEARTEVATGSLLGGICLGPVNTAAVHALAYPLGSMFHLAHGLSNALLLPYVMEFNLPASPCRYANVAVALGCSTGPNDVATARQGIAVVRSLIKDCGLPAGLGEAGISREAIPAMAKEAMKITRLLKNNPRTITEQDAIEIYNAAF
jgi:alcohol dehydrogenase class IV